MEAPISASLGAMGSLLGKLDEILDTEPKDEIRKLREDLVVTRALMLKLSKARDPPVTARYWMKDVRELSYDMEDCIDAETSDWIERMPVFKTLVGEANERYHTYMLEDSAPSGADFAIDYRLPTVNGRKAVVGLDGPIDKLCQPLSDQYPELKVVSIVGVGGIGKTTLAEQLWHKLGGAFQCRAFVQTCKRPDMRSILRSILSQVRPHQPPPGVSDVHKLTQDIHEHLQDKSYFVIIDDLWATSVWEIVNRAFPEGNLGSRIITTTETEDVALACCAYQSRYIFKMEPLSFQHSKELFTSALFWSREKQLDECSQEIMRRCGGLPQAIVSIASILARNQETETVENTGKQLDYLQNFILNDLGEDTPFEEILKQVLNLCYNSLPSCLQTCLLYLSVYSENCIIFKEDLTKQWVVEGFICASTKKETMKISQSYFDKLVNMGLIRHIDVKNSDEVLSYAVHHMVHDFITSKSIEENFITVMDYSQSTMQLSDKVRRLSLQFGSAAYATTPASTRLSQVRSLNFIGLVTCIPSLSDFKLLRVLILNLWGDQGSTSFALTIISELFLLRYLQIICNIIVQLPDQMQGLEHLETLEINARPDQSLLHLRLRGGINLPHATLYPSASSSEPCYPSDPVKTFELLPPLCCLPTWIGKLSKLCTLKIVVRELLNDDISSLGGLPALTVLSLHVKRHTAEIIVFNTAQFPALEYFELKCGVLSLAFQEGAMPNLEMLKVGFNAHKGEQYGHFLVGIEHLPNLKGVVGIIGVVGGAEEPDWTAAESAFKDTILPFLKLYIEVNVKRADWIEEEYGSPENQHLSQEKHPLSEQPGRIKEESYGDIKQNSDSESASALSSFLHPDTKQTKPISSAQLLVPMALSGFNKYAEVLSNINACREFFSWTASGIKTAMRYRHNTINLHDEENIAAQCRIQEEIEQLDAKLGQLKDGLWKLKTTMPKMLDLIDRVEFQSHKQHAAALLPDIKDTVYDAEDLLDEFDYYILKLKVDRSKYSGQDHLDDTFMEFLACVGSNDYIREVNRIQAKLDHIHLQSKDMGLDKAPLKFDELVRPKTDSNLIEELHGRKKELKQLLGKLGVHERKRGRTVSNKAKMTELPVVSIVGMGGVGKTTMAQQICKTQGRHFDCTIWTCVSDDFDLKVLTKEIIEGLQGDASFNSLDVLMRELERLVKSKKFLLVVDDMRDDILKDNGAKWKRLCAPLKNGAEGSRILVTTRFLEVAELVGPDNHYELNGLQDAVFWDFFKLCAFGSKPSCSNQDQEALECIGQKIVPKLKGSPLAAKTIGRILGMDLSTTHWENIMGSELWRVEEQYETDILPALRLSYLYLPQKLKRCFSICAMYPKDHEFGKDMLADIWIAQGYVVGPQEASLCFDALANRSFFQKASPTSITKYVIHDLMHDTAQLISKDECFIIKHASDLDKVPSNVRHLSIFTNKDFQCSELKIICKKKKLRSLVCNESYSRAQDFYSVIDSWFKELSKLRLLSLKLSNVPRLPDSIGNSKHLRYLCLHGKTTFNNFPSAVCHLHLLKVINCGSCSIGRFPSEFTGAISLQRIKSKNFTYHRDQSDKLCLKWRTGVKIKENQMEALPHWDVQHLHVEEYEGESCPSWLQPNQMLRLRSLEFHRCNKIKSISFFVPSDGSHDNAAGSVDCNHLEEFVVVMCEQIDWQGSVLPTSLRKIQLDQPGQSMDHFVSCFLDLTSLTCLEIARCESLTSIPLHVWRSNLPSLADLIIDTCNNLTSISTSGASNSSSNSSEGGSVNGFSSLAKIRVESCGALLSLEELLMPDCVPVVKDICVSDCGELTSLFFDSLDGLQKLHIASCSKLNPQRVMTFPSSLKRLTLRFCDGIESINLANSPLADCKGLNLANSPLAALEEVEIVNCKGLRSVGGAAAVDNISRIKGVFISGCPKLQEIQQPVLHGTKMWRGSAGVSSHQASAPAGSSSAGGSRDHAAGSGSD